IDSGRTGGTWVDIQDVSFINPAAAKDTLSMVMWIKKYDIAAGSAFWAAMAGGERVFQAHIPWSDDTIYFDTAGCCDGTTQRISAPITDFPDYMAVGNDGYWTNWHHFVFTKKADQKNIYIDGKLFLNGSSTAPLQPFVELALLTDGFPNDFMHGLIDDFAVYSTEISAADAAKLASGTSPRALTGETLLAYWNFDDAIAQAPPTIGIAREGAVLKITYTGTLQSTTTIGGQWNDVQGATSPYSVTTASGPASSFYRAKQ